MVWTVLAHLDDLALDEERAARHALDDAQVDDEDVARDDPAVEGIVLHDGRERMVFAERNADSAARSYELKGPVLRETQNGVDARRRERGRHARAGRAALGVAKADPGAARNGKTPVARRHFPPPRSRD